MGLKLRLLLDVIYTESNVNLRKITDSLLLKTLLEVLDKTFVTVEFNMVFIFETDSHELA